MIWVCQIELFVWIVVKNIDWRRYKMKFLFLFSWFIIFFVIWILTSLAQKENNNSSISVWELISDGFIAGFLMTLFVGLPILGIVYLFV